MRRKQQGTGTLQTSSARDGHFLKSRYMCCNTRDPSQQATRWNNRTIKMHAQATILAGLMPQGPWSLERGQCGAWCVGVWCMVVLREGVVQGPFPLCRYARLWPSYYSPQNCTANSNTNTNTNRRRSNSKTFLFSHPRLHPLVSFFVTALYIFTVNLDVIVNLFKSPIVRPPSHQPRREQLRPQRSNEAQCWQRGNATTGALPAKSKPSQ